MLTGFQPFLDLLTSPPGNLIYHLVVSFCLVSVLPVIFYLRRSEQKPLHNRLLLGFFPLLALRMSLFITGGLAWQGLIAEQVPLPALERSVGLLSLVILLWLWGFPQPQRRAEGAVLLSLFLGFFFVTLFSLWWHNQRSSISFDGNRIDRIATLGSALIALIALLLLVIRRPDGWGTGVLFFLIIGIGYFMLLSLGADYSGIIRLAEVAAYPLLIMLPLRSPLAVVESKAPSPAATAASAKLTPLEIQLIQTCLSLPVEMQRGRLSNALSALFARAFRADLCYLLSPPDESWQILLHGGYDLIREADVEGGILDGRQIPTIAANLRHAKPMRVQADAPTPDLSYLASALKLERSGNLLMGVILSEDQAPLFGVILLSPYSNHLWTGEEQIQLVNLCRLVGRLLRPLQLQAQTGAELAEAQKALAEAKEQLGALQAELTALRVNSAPETKMAQEGSPVVPLSTTNRATSLEGELRLALEEIAHLRTELEESRRQLRQAQLENGSAEGSELLINLTTELRQPLASIVGYTDFLLSESVGILGTLQRKFLERIRIATQRMTAILNDYAPVTDPKGGQVRLSLGAVPLSSVLQNAIAEVQELKKIRQVDLQSEIPVDLPPVLGDSGALEQILVRLLQNALKVSPAGSTVRVRVRGEKENNIPGYLLLQIQDCGNGVAPEDIPDIFARERHTELKGVAESGAALYLVKTLVEALNGRIWVDSQPGEGTTFSLLLNLATPNLEDGLLEEIEL
ncbi:MAG: ATP-binding protein [Anaerolineales bacterium]|nr:ATP-binding protein [Anaerolineales bacterium]MDW8447966.1 ATP-binding protein [Anaerolineales bacterium]